MTTKPLSCVLLSLVVAASRTARACTDEICGNGIDDDCDSVVDNCSVSVEDADLRVFGSRDGHAVASAMSGSWSDTVDTGDLTGDGTVDLLFASWKWNTSNGAVYIADGATRPTTLDDAIAVSAVNDAFFGFSIDAGDANGDGFDDLLVGSPAASTERAQLFLGPITADLSAGEAVADFTNARGEWTGWDVDVVPDFDGDGAADVTVGAINYWGGKVFVAPGVSSGTVELRNEATYSYQGPERGTGLGSHTVEMGDHDGDGIDDLALGTDAGAFRVNAAVYVIDGGGSPGDYWADSVAAATIVDDGGEAPRVYLGSSLFGDDIDGDGFSDLLVSAIAAGPDSAGVVYGFLGPLSGALWRRDADVHWESAGGAYTWFGQTVSTGDADGDGTRDVLISGGEGAFLDLGAETAGVITSDALVHFERRIAGNTYTGASFVPDWTGDGADEVAIVLPDVHVAGEVHGAEYIFDSDGRF